MTAGSPDAPPYLYEPSFGLRESPFTLTPNTRYLFESESHRAALAQIALALPRHEPLIVITGEVGTGKTMLCHIVAERRDERTFVAMVATPPASGDDLLREILDGFGVLPRDSSRVAQAGRFELVRTLQQFLSSLVPLRAQAVIVIDEAHRLPLEAFEQLRTLSNLETESRKLLQIILVGEPELDELLARPELRPLRQRVTRRRELQPLLPGEIGPYIERRLQVARAGDASSRGVFSASAVDAIGVLSRGIPRIVNVLCDRALENAAARRLRRVDVKAVAAAAEMLKLPVPFALRARGRLRWAAMAAAIVALAGAGGGWWMLRGPAIVRQAVAPPGSRAPRPAPAGAAARTSAPTAASAPEIRPNVPGGTREEAAAPSPAPAAPSGRSAGPGSGGYVVIVSSFRTPGRAEAAAAEVARLGLPASTRSTASGWHQVVVGPYATRDEAAQARDRLAAAHQTDAQIAPIDSTLGGPAGGAQSNGPAAVRSTDAATRSLPSVAPLRPEQVLERASALARQPDVRALMQLRADVARRASAADVEALLKRLDEYLDEARRRQLELDRRR